NVGERLSLVTPSARSSPSLTCGAAGGIAENATGVCPPTVDWMAGPAPANCTVTRSMPCEARKISPDRCGVLPTPGAAKLYFPGLALMRSISSLMVLAGTEGCTVITLGETATMVTGAKSLTGS